jgi:hypothetical protein
MKTLSIKLTKLEIDIILESLNAHLAGTPGEGDLCWGKKKIDTAHSLTEKIGARL